MSVIVGQPPLYPHHCGVLPQLVNVAVSPTERYVDTNQDFIQGGQIERLYVSETAARELAREFGHPTHADHVTALAELEALRAENEDLKLQLREADEELNGISLLKARGYQPVKRVGRPPVKKAA